MDDAVIHKVESVSSPVSPQKKSLKGNRLAKDFKSLMRTKLTGDVDLTITEVALTALKQLPISIDMHMQLDKAKPIDFNQLKIAKRA